MMKEHRWMLAITFGPGLLGLIVVGILVNVANCGRSGSSPPPPAPPADQRAR
jgi:hypothetical protein